MTFAARANSGPSSGPTSAFNGQTVSYSTSGGTSSATVTFNTDGTVISSGTVTSSGDFTSSWFNPTTSGIGTSYWVQSPPTPSLIAGQSVSWTGGQWLQITTNRPFTITMTLTGAFAVNAVFNIAATSGGTVLATGTIFMDAERV